MRAATPIRKSALLALVGLVAGLAAASARADDSGLEYRVKAVYLYKLGAFVEWPQSTFESPTSAMNVCVAGRDPFDGILDKAVEGQRIAGHPVVIRRLKNVVRNSGCQILYVGGSDDQSIAAGLDAVRGTGVLTVTDAASGPAAGIIQFVNDENHVRFDIDDRAASADGLMISSKLLSLATSVKPRS